MHRRFLISFVIGTITILVSYSQVHAQWSIVKKFVQPQIKVIEESNDQLILFHPVVGDTLILTKEQKPHSDIFGKVIQRRGSNPYRIWYVHPNLASDPARPKTT